VRKRNTAKESLLTNILSKNFATRHSNRVLNGGLSMNFGVNILHPTWLLHSGNKASKVALKLRPTYINEKDLDEMVTSMLYKQ
jgi:hypothetical protein